MTIATNYYQVATPQICVPLTLWGIDWCEMFMLRVGLQEELLRLRQAMGDGQAARTHSFGPDKQAQASVMPWIGVAIAMALFGIIIGKFFMWSGPAPRTPRPAPAPPASRLPVRPSHEAASHPSGRRSLLISHVGEISFRLKWNILWQEVHVKSFIFKLGFHFLFYDCLSTGEELQPFIFILIGRFV